jgi:flagellar biosynthesis chaperone FliJ
MRGAVNSLSCDTLSLCFSLTNYPIYPPSSSVNNDCLEVDELILEIADYKNDYADVAAEKLLRKCSTSWEAYQYLQDRVHDGWLPNDARQQLRRIVKRIQVQIHQSREYGWAYEYS